MINFFNPEIFLDIAKKVKDSNDLDEQGRLRTSIGRAYYAAFLATRERLRFRGIKFEKERQHQDVLDALDDLDEYNIKYQLETLRTFRINADYYLNILIDKNLCEKSIILSEEIINSIEMI